eukprot:1159877-Pelagomonas_calceolata.AAC.8
MAVWQEADTKAYRAVCLWRHTRQYDSTARQIHKHTRQCACSAIQFQKRARGTPAYPKKSERQRHKRGDTLVGMGLRSDNGPEGALNHKSLSPFQLWLYHRRNSDLQACWADSP